LLVWFAAGARGWCQVPGIYSRFSVAAAAAALFGLGRADQTIVHRLDEATSGVMVLARTPEAQRNL
jgi:23S rRNA-/tRNA-specific pseudouridylate synthase